MVGAPSVGAIGLFYQWGAVLGHDESESFDYSELAYEEQGLNLITSDLNDSQDAARAFYGPVAKMPSEEQISELFSYTSIRRIGSEFIITSNINGESLTFKAAGYYHGVTKDTNARLYSWLRNISPNSFTIFGNTTHNINNFTRYFGINIMAVHS